MPALRWLKKLARCESGNALAICAAAMPLVIGAAAMGVDTVQASLARRQLQRMADSAALAGAYALAQSQTAATAVNHDLTLNDDVALSVSPVIENAPTTGPWAGNARAVRVVLTTERAVPFMGFFTGDTMTVTTEATATWDYSGEYCAVALEEAATAGITLIGNAVVDLGCGMISNSSGNSAVTANGSSTVVASPIAAVGNVPSSNNYASGTELLPYSLPIEDPYADLPEPTVPSSCNNELRVQPNDLPRVILPTEATSLGSGVYCFRGMDIKGSLTLLPGTYIIDGGSLSFGSQANVTSLGLGVTFILTSRNAATAPSQIAQLSLNAGATINLTAPETGTYAGILMYQDRRSPWGTSHINGNSNSYFHGGFYFSNRELVFNGTAGMETECVQLVGRRLGFSGNASISNDCDDGGASEAFQGKNVRLVG